MANTVAPKTTMRVGVFSTIKQAERVVDSLLTAGFSKEQITVICSNEKRQEHFREFKHELLGTKIAPEAVAVGGAVGATLGGLATVVAGLATGGAAVVFTAGAAAWAGAVAGGLVGAMMTRGVGREPADYYDLAVSQGKVLVAAEDHDSHGEAQLSKAEQIFADNGAVPLALQDT